MSADQTDPRLLQGVTAAIKAAGSAAELARQVGVTRFAVHQWRSSGIPLARVAKVSKVTGIPSKSLRPDFFEVAA